MIENPLEKMVNIIFHYFPWVWKMMFPLNDVPIENL